MDNTQFVWDKETPHSSTLTRLEDGKSVGGVHIKSIRVPRGWEISLHNPCFEVQEGLYPTREEAKAALERLIAEDL